MPTTSLSPSAVWKMMPAQWVVLTMAAAALIATYWNGLVFMVAHWEQVPEYSYGWFIPVISGFLIWQKADRLRQLELRGEWSGLWLLAVALALGAVGELSAVRVFSQYGFVVALFGLAVCAIGWRGTRVIALPLALLLTMIPLPQFVLRELSQQLQLVSSELGVWLIRGFGISVFLEGNVIDLGSYKLQVVEACSGLRYLFPLMVLGLLAAYFFQGAMWKRVLIVLSTVPLTIVINSLRIGLIGITVEYWGSDMAEGLLHDFEGWFMFMLCIALLIGEMALLARIGAKPASLGEVFGIDYPAPFPRGAAFNYRQLSLPALAAAAFIGAVGLLTTWGNARELSKPGPSPFAEFPMSLPGGWVGQPDRLERDIVATLAVDDYLLANYTREREPWVNLYGAWYANQSGGQSSHSPRTCIPGGGWTITELGETSLASDAGAMKVNRAVIQKGEHRQLVYYWFSQRGRTLTSELAVKWYILHDGIRSGRTDGALLRLVTPVPPNEDLARAEQRLGAFLAAVGPRLGGQMPLTEVPALARRTP
jgi:exosortase D (VPLPA-CTERM-specific)